MRVFEGSGDRLFRHDRWIVVNTLRANFAGWRDRLMGGAVLLAAVLFIRSWVGDQDWKTAAWATLGAGLIAGMGAGRLVAARIEFHSFHGVLAADALHPSSRRRYVAAWHGLALATLAVITLVARPSLLIVSVPAYLAGVFIARITNVLTIKGEVIGSAALGWRIRRLLHHTGAGIVAAMVLLFSLLLASALGETGLMAAVGIGTVLFAAALTTVQQDVARFMTIAGHGPWRIIFRHSKATLLFAGLAASGSWFVLGPVAAGIILTVSLAMLLLLAMRVLAYCAHDKRFADFLVSIVVGLLMVVAYSAPVLLPFVATAALWHLHRRAVAHAWLLV